MSVIFFLMSISSMSHEDARVTLSMLRFKGPRDVTLLLQSLCDDVMSGQGFTEGAVRGSHPYPAERTFCP